MQVAIVGAGLIGLASAYELRKRGADVVVYERDEAAGAASWAGAGMLAPYSEALADGALAALCVASLARYPAFVAEIRERTGIDPHLRVDGTLHLALSAADEARLDGLAAPLGAAAQRLSRSETLEAEPAVSKHVRGGLLIAGEGQIDNRRLGRALVAACRAAGVRLEEGCGEIAIEADERRVLGLRTPHGFRPASVVVNAVGAWAGSLPGVPAKAKVAVGPVKGQIVSLAVPRGFARRLIWTDDVYLVPRADGRLLVGATVEDAGFDRRVTAQGVASLLTAALRAAPSLGGFTLSETWAGLRPGAAGGRPSIGATALEGYFVASGHYRNGILLAPVTAELLADAIEGRPAPLDARAFDPRRAEAAHAAWNLSA